jgi:hypothetical protein
MPQYGSTQNLISQNLSQTVDNQGNPIISSDTGFGASPLGYAARVQALFGLPNATFELTPPDTTAIISAANQLPYWDIQDYSSAVMSGSAIYDSTTNAWGVNLNPGTAASGDYLTMTTRSYLVNDSNLSLRQQALSVVSKVGTYAGATQWNLNLVATYYDQTDTLLHSGTVATILDNATWTSMAGTTTTGGTAISAAAHYVDLTYTLTATAAVTSSTSVTIKSCLLQTSSGAAAGGGFIVTDTFTSSGTWTRPTGVEYLVAVIAYGGGGGGASGNNWWGFASSAKGRGGGGGGGSRLALVRDVSIGTAASISVGIGAGGAGGAGGTITKTTSGTAELNSGGVDGAAGGATTFGTYFTVNPGGGGVANPNSTLGRGGSAGAATTSIVLGVTDYIGGTGAGGGSVTSGNLVGHAAPAPGTAATEPFSVISYLTQTGTVGAAGGTANAVKTGTGSGTVYAQSPSLAGTGLNYLLGGGGGAGGIPTDASGTVTPGANSNGGLGAGGAGGGFLHTVYSGTVALSGTAGSGGSAGANTGAGGGAGGAALQYATSSARHSDSRGTTVAGSGGNGGSGLLTVVYIG